MDFERGIKERLHMPLYAVLYVTAAYRMGGEEGLTAAIDEVFAAHGGGDDVLRKSLMVAALAAADAEVQLAGKDLTIDEKRQADVDLASSIAPDPSPGASLSFTPIMMTPDRQLAMVPMDMAADALENYSKDGELFVQAQLVPGTDGEYRLTVCHMDTKTMELAFPVITLSGDGMIKATTPGKEVWH